MASDERTRIDLAERLAQVVGPDLAAYMMQTIPPMAWSDLATKTDLADIRDSLSERFDLRLEATKHELRAEIKDVKESLIRWVVPTTLIGISVSTSTVAVVTALLS